VFAVGDLGGTGHGCRVLCHRHPEHLVPPGELLLDVHVGRVVDRDDATTAAHVLLDRGALRVVVPHHSRGLQHHDHVERGKRGVVEDRRVLALGQLPLVLCRQLFDHGDPRGDRIMPVGSGRGLAEQQDVQTFRVRCGDRRSQADHHQDTADDR
jgi:hypothetical protein